MPTPPRSNSLLEPLLPSSSDNEDHDENNVEEEIIALQPTVTVGQNVNGECEDNDAEHEQEFTIRSEIVEMVSLGFPLAVSFFCRMGMASTDSAFVGHLHDHSYSAEIYLAASVLSDMCVNVFVTPALAFNQVLNGLVGQAMGSNNPKMAGVWLQQSMFWLALAMLPFLAAFFFVEEVLLMLGFDDNVSALAGTYAKYNLLWPIPNGLYQCMRFYFQAQGMPRQAMYNNILFLFVNALLNWIFVFGGPFSWNGLGFIGAGISLSISRTMQSAVYFIYMFLYKKHHLATWPDAGWSLEHHTWDRTKEFMKQSVPNIGTLLFQCCTSQATTVLVGRLGEGAIAASSALSTVSIPWAGTLSATCTTISGVRTGYHLGRGKGEAAKKSVRLVLYFITITNILVAAVFFPFKDSILRIATDDVDLQKSAAKLVPAMLIGTYLNVLVSNITSGVFSGMGRPLIATILSFGLELPLSLGGVALYIIVMHGNLLGVYWLQAILGGVEILVVLFILLRSDFDYWADEARKRQETAGSNANSNSDGDNDDDNKEWRDEETNIPTELSEDSGGNDNQVENSEESAI